MGGATVAAAAIVSDLLGGGSTSAEAADRSVVLIDNSNADSWLEVDRTNNLQLGSGIAGSDLDGAATDLSSVLVSRPDVSQGRAGALQGAAEAPKGPEIPQGPNDDASHVPQEVRGAVAHGPSEPVAPEPTR
ncbi:hypothetical protein QOM21_03730 [Streptomyces sp. Pv4-95]|uniref:hypothetical protein n=1 Tax=Streptomyces sp. Pv4-95 TaxID=3049543 RepID=UPI003891553C